ncbi:MAG: hypothetical protein ACI4WH_07115 [Oscillospiraceae bacterium]
MLRVSVVLTGESLGEVLSNVSKDSEQSNQLVKLISNVNELTNMVISFYQLRNENFNDVIYRPELYLYNECDSCRFGFGGIFILDRFEISYCSIESTFYAITENQDEEFEGSFDELKNFITDAIY